MRYNNKWFIKSIFLITLYIIIFPIISKYYKASDSIIVRICVIALGTMYVLFGYYTKSNSIVLNVTATIPVCLLGGYLFLENIVLICFGFHLNEILNDVIAIVLNTNNGEILSFVYLFKSKEFYKNLLLILCPVIYYIIISSKKVFNNFHKDTYAHYLLYGIYIITFALCVFPGFKIRNFLNQLPDCYNSAKDNSEYYISKANFKWNSFSQINNNKSTVFIVLGETTRGDHMSINGYLRPTTPNLSAHKVVSFKNAISIGTHTLSSTPFILTRKPVSDEWINKLYPETSIISAFKEAGYKTYYISYLKNIHIGDNAINQIVNEADNYIQRPYIEGNDNDGLGLDIIRKILGSDQSTKRLIIFKLIGSHWHFQDRYPLEYDYYQPSFKQIAFNGPDLRQKDIFVNTYDNSILYTDFIVGSIIDMLENENGEVSLSFISDHGISIYEDNKTIYSGNKKANYNIACFFWANEAVKKRLNKKWNIFNQNQNKPVDQTYFIDTVMDVSGIDSEKKTGKTLFKNISEVDNRLVIYGSTIKSYKDIK